MLMGLITCSHRFMETTKVPKPWLKILYRDKDDARLAVTDGKVTLNYCPTEQMVADIMTQPPTKSKLKRFQLKVFMMKVFLFGE